MAKPAKRTTKKTSGKRSPAKKSTRATKAVDDYRHEEATRVNNPEAGLARYETKPPPTKTYEYDPRIDPQLQWAGKAERTPASV